MANIKLQETTFFPELSSFSVDSADSISLEYALKALKLGDFEERWFIAKVLIKYHSQTVINPLKDIILDENANIDHRWYSLKILSEIKNPEIILIVTQLLMITQDEDLLILATQTLTNQGKQSIRFLSSLLNNSDYRLCVTKALSQIPSLDVIEPLLSVINDPDSTIRTIALSALKNYDTPKITEVLINALKDHHSSIRKEAVIGLGLKLKSNQDIALVKVILPLLHDLNLSVAQQTATVLSRCTHAFVVDYLEKMLHYVTTPEPLKVTIVRSLGWIATVQSIECLGKSLIDGVDLSVSLEIIKILGRVNQCELKSQAIQILGNFYESKSPKLANSDILQALCYSLKQLKAIDTIAILKTIETNQNIKVRLHAESALTEISSLLTNPHNFW